MKNPALLVVDIQNGFVEESELPVPGGGELIEPINKLMPLFPVVVATQDWHPPDHGSFYTRHRGAKPYEMGELGGEPQVLWPVHCVAGTRGADFVEGLKVEYLQAVIRKGMDPEVDSYSTFYDNFHRNPSGLRGYLRERGVDAIFLAGLAFDYCVLYSARDALEFTSEIYVIEDACRAVSPDTAAAAREEMISKNINLLKIGDVVNLLTNSGISGAFPRE